MKAVEAANTLKQKNIEPGVVLNVDVPILRLNDILAMAVVVLP